MKRVHLVSTTVSLAVALVAASAAAAPEPPGQVQVRVLNGALQVNWQKSPSDPLNVSGYEVVRGIFPTGPFQPVCVTMKGAVSCMDRNVQPEKPYFYKVRSIGIGDDGPSTFTSHVPGELPRTTVAER